MNKIARVLVSVTDKTGIVEFAKALASEFKVEIVSTGGTAKALRDSGVPVRDISDLTGFPEMLDGRVKTLHPKVHGGILGVRTNPEHSKQMSAHAIQPIDMVVVNLYRFEQTVAKPGVTVDEAIENIDIGGPSMVRSAAKNHKFVSIVTSPAQYGAVLAEMRKNGGAVSEETNRSIAAEAFRLTATYDSAIANYLSRLEAKDAMPGFVGLPLTRVRELRYGENPHQTAAYYALSGDNDSALSAATVVSEGKELSYNNILDLDAALEIAREFTRPTVVIVKHNNPCGVGCHDVLAEAFKKAHSGDPVSAYGSVIAVNRKIDAATAELMTGPNMFIEVLVAPDFEPEALKILTTKPKWGKSVRLVKMKSFDRPAGKRCDSRGAVGGVLYQVKDDSLFDEAKLRTATMEPTPQQRADLMFAWKVCKHVKSNAIVLAKDETVLGVGAGQMSRVDSSHIAVRKAGDRAKGAVLASDAFFPFKDALEVALDAGVCAAIQPGGSMRDAELVALAKERNIPMLITGQRHFKH